MNGTDKQVAFAEAIKAKVWSEIDKNLTGSETAQKIKQALENAPAKWWIDNRDVISTDARGTIILMAKQLGF